MDKAQPVKMNFIGLKKRKIDQRKAYELDAENTLENPYRIVPDEKDFSVEQNVIESSIDLYSFYICKFAVGR